MPTDTATQSVEVPATQADVLALLRDVASQPEWIPEIKEAEVLTSDGHGRPLTARFAASSSVGTDRYILAYEHSPHGLRWSMVKGRLQTGQEGVYTLESAGRGRTKVTYQLTIHHNLPLPGFLRSRVIKGLVSDTLTGLQGRFGG
ncbi:SRPBCC family protein [Knoellia sp. p5-6-4]|uniref:SRPBCC family protein n=1 Tax=unclassified Knoellia TaxID=2618719 RepID=UPI0023DC8ADB|nr:SRPBCC family protein [Knoellia sp. p5-6-4]MDF2145409.1 SRPBCC family protein [Knoellia sp. p5-6-4]